MVVSALPLTAAAAPAWERELQPPVTFTAEQPVA